MTAEKRYELIVGMLRMHEVNGLTEGITDEVIKNPSAWVNSELLPFYANGAQLILECREEMDKQNGVASSSLAAIKRIYKSACSSTSKEEFHGAFKSGEKWTICDGYRIVRLNSKPESIPETKSDLDIERAIGSARDGEIVALPSVSEVKTKIAELKAMYGRNWKNMPIEPLPGWYCNPQYLLDMLQALPNGRAHLPKNSISPLYYESDDGDALVLPVRHKTN